MRGRPRSGSLVGGRASYSSRSAPPRPPRSVAAETLEDLYVDAICDDGTVVSLNVHGYRTDPAATKPGGLSTFFLPPASVALPHGYTHLLRTKTVGKGIWRLTNASQRQLEGTTRAVKGPRALYLA